MVSPYERIVLTKPFNGQTATMEIDPQIGEDGIRDQIYRFVTYGVDVGRKLKRFYRCKQFVSSYAKDH